MRQVASVCLLTVVLSSACVQCTTVTSKDGTKHFQERELESAQEQFLRAIEKEPENSQAHFMLGHIFQQKGDYGKMLEHYDLSLEYSDEFHSEIEMNKLQAFNTIFFDSARAYNASLEEQDEKKGTALLESCIEPLKIAYDLQGNVSALELLGACYMRLANEEEAEKCFKRVLAIDPENYNSLANLSTMKFSQAMDADEDPELYNEALNYYLEFIECYPERLSRNVSNLARLYDGLGQTEKVIQYYERILQRYRHDDEVNVELTASMGMAMIKSGDQEAGMAQLRKAAENDRHRLEILERAVYPLVFDEFVQLWNDLSAKIDSNEGLSVDEITTVLPYMERFTDLDESNSIAWEVLVSMYSSLDQMGVEGFDKKLEDARKRLAGFQQH